jgi:hypothetical protein
MPCAAFLGSTKVLQAGGDGHGRLLGRKGCGHPSPAWLVSSKPGHWHGLALRSV